MTRYLAIDIGDKRSGLAVADDVSGIVSPAGTLEVPRGPALLDALQDAITQQVPDELVIGLPLNMDGSEGERAKIVREVGSALESACGLVVRYQDERLTSFAADQAMARSGRTHKQKKNLRDALAAVAILSDFLERS